MNILINYLYEHYPFTTASYFEMACRRSPDHTCYRSNNYNPESIDLVLNIEPVGDIIKIPGVPSVYYEIDNHIIKGNDRHFYDKVDLVLLAQKTNELFYSDYKIAILPLACYPKLHKRYHDEKQIYDIGFIGNDTYPHRRKLLEMLKQNFKVLCTTSEPGEKYSRLLNQCKLTFNCSMQNDVNMRFFEAISCGRLLLTDYLPDQDNYATKFKHYLIYSSGNTLLGRVRYYLKHEKERERIAKAGMIHIQQNHNYDIRLKQLLCLIKPQVSSSL